VHIPTLSNSLKTRLLSSRHTVGYYGVQRPMKKAITILSVAFLLITSIVMAGQHDEREKSNPRYKNLFVFKTDKKFLGAKIEILSATGSVITSQNLERRKIVIDFGDVGYGTYTIRVSKGNQTKEFLFVKN
jgi:hypothetical protein